MNGKSGWQTATFLVTLVAVGVGGYAYMQYSAATTLTAQLAATTADSQQARAEAATLRDQLLAAQNQVSNEQQKLRSTEANLAAEVRPDLPINLSFRRALLNPGLVAVIRNTSGRELEITLDVESSVTGQHARRAVVINPNGVWEFGAQEGWPFAPGQRITLNNPAYRPIVQVVGG
jgi:uncharacterized protein YaiL (DUF2058 family)